MSDLNTLCMGLLEQEEKWRELGVKKKKDLPNREAAGKAVRKARTSRTIMCVILVILAAVAYFVVWPKIATVSEDPSFEEIFFTGICKLIFWVVLVILAGITVLFFWRSVSPQDKRAEQIYQENKRYNDNLEAGLAEAKKRHEELVEQLCREAGISRDRKNKKYFFEFPFDPSKDYRALKDGISFLGDDMSNTFTSGPPMLHKYQEDRPLRLDGFHAGKYCKAKEAMKVLPDSDYVKLYGNRAWLEANPDAKCILFGVWEMVGLPLDRGKAYKLNNLPLKDILLPFTRNLSDAGLFLCSGIDAYEPFVPARIRRSEIPDNRNDLFAQEKKTFVYGELKEVDFENLFQAYEYRLLEHGYLVISASGEGLLCMALPAGGVPEHRFHFNVGKGSYSKWEDYHGYVAGYEVPGRVRVDKAATMEYLRRCCSSYMRMFNPLTEKPDGLSDDLFHLWMSCWYRGYQQQRSQKK